MRVALTRGLRTATVTEAELRGGHAPCRVQYLQERIDSASACPILSVASQYSLGDLAKRACGCILGHIAAVTCPEALVDEVYWLPPHALEWLLQSASQIMSVRATPTRKSG